MCRQCQETFDFLRGFYPRGKPTEAGGMIRLIHQSFVEKAPLRFVGFWGAGLKAKPDKADQIWLARFAEELIFPLSRHFGLQAEMTFILADAHALQNDSTPDGWERDSGYLEQVGRFLVQSGFEARWLSWLWVKWWKTTPSFRFPSEEWWRLNDYLRQELLRMAQNHHRKDESVEEAAWRYVAMRSLEAPRLAEEYAGAIFHCFAGREMRPVLPSMPTLFLKSTLGEKGVHNPWFWFLE